MSIRGWLVRNTVIRFFGWATSYKRPIETQRRNLHWFGKLSPPPRSTRIEELDCNGVACTLIAAKNVAEDAPLFLYFHGGGYVIGSPYTYRDFGSQISRALGMRVLMPDYRLAPEHPYPVGIDDAYSAWQWILQQGQQAADTMIAGDSAGAGMAAALMMRIKGKAETQPAKAWLISPFCDLTFSGASYETHVKRDVELSPQVLQQWGNAFVDADKLAGYPELNPCTEDLSGWPPICIQVGTEEVLLDDSRMLRDNAAKYDIECDYSEWQGMWHVFQPYGKFAPEPKQAFNAAMAFFKK